MTTAAAGGEAGVRELSAEQFGELLSTREGLQLMDVREDWEFETARIKGFVLKPLSRFAEWCDVTCIPFAVSLAVSRIRRAPTIGEDYNPQEPVFVLCHHGVRSRSAANWLVQQAGFTVVYNISGGIDAFARQVDDSIPLY
jgi:rhodanese-related sulfurtransferase